MLEDYPDVLTLNEAAEVLQVTPLTLKRWEKKGKIQPLRINVRGDRRYLKKQILSMLGLDYDKKFLEEYPEILTINEASDILRVAPLTLKRWEKKGKIQPLRINTRGDRRYTKEQILALLGVDDVL